MTAVLYSWLLEQHNIFQSLPVLSARLTKKTFCILLTSVLSCLVSGEEMLLHSMSLSQTVCSKTDELGSLCPTNKTSLGD